MKTEVAYRPRFIVVGCGNIGERHIHLASLHGKILAVCDVDKKRLSVISNKYSCTPYTSLTNMLTAHADADVLVVCTPNGLHAAHSIAGLKAGFHVLCEKPMALTKRDCLKMIAVSAKAGKKLLVVKQNRYNPPVDAVKKLLSQKKLGEVYNIQINCFWNRNKSYYNRSKWRGTNKNDGGILFTQFSHFIDVLYWFFGDIAKVEGFISNKGHKGVTEIEDTGVFSFVTASGIPGTLHCTTNSFQKNYEGSITIFAKNATIKIGGSYLNEIEYQQPVLINRKTLTAGNSANLYKGYSGSMNNHDAVYKEMLYLLTGKQHKAILGEDAVHSINIIEKFYKAAREVKSYATI